MDKTIKTYEKKLTEINYVMQLDGNNIGATKLVRICIITKKQTWCNYII